MFYGSWFFSTSAIVYVPPGSEGHLVRVLARIFLFILAMKAFMSYAQVCELKEKVAAAKDMKELETIASIYRKTMDQLKLMAKSVGKSTQKVSGHVANLKRQEEREKAKRKSEEEAMEVQKVRAQAKLAAKKVARQAEEPSALFSMGLDKLLADSLADACAGIKEKDMMDPEKPAIIYCTEGLKSWSAHAKVEVALGFFGGKDKKTEAYNQERLRDAKP